MCVRARVCTHVTGEEGGQATRKRAAVERDGTEDGAKKRGKGEGGEEGRGDGGFSETHLQFKTRFGIMKM